MTRRTRKISDERRGILEFGFIVLGNMFVDVKFFIGFDFLVTYFFKKKGSFSP